LPVDSVEAVVAVAAEHVVAAGPAGQAVAARVAGEPVVGAVAGQRVVAVTAGELLDTSARTSSSSSAWPSLGPSPIVATIGVVRAK
jgi:hypothetical protein